MRVALVQMNSGADVEKNLVRALMFCRTAVGRGAKFILLPEVCLFRGSIATEKNRKDAVNSIPGPLTRPFQEFARKNKVHVLLGSVHERIPNSVKTFNTAVLIDPRGRIAARYRKINLFRARLPGKSIDESATQRAGNQIALVKVNEFKVALTICYDLRFPQLYRECARRGADVLLVPSSFTRTTGKAHFEVLLRARAIENLCYVLAPDQVGNDDRGIVAFGNSMVIDPWGKVLARADGCREKVLVVDIGQSGLKQSRRTLPGFNGKHY